ncbi:MAG: biotin--[acetyl-CoA-carboxylase] ligase, partial [Lutibacter sp.]
MNLIKLDAIDSTNKYLKQLSTEKALDNFTVVWTQIQENGRGQIGTIWESEPNKNLMFSVLLKFDELKIVDRFYLNMAISLGLLIALKETVLDNFNIKWPNDILSAKDKVAGILIETNFSGEWIKQAIVGIGLNVNQVKFGKQLKNVASLKLLTNKDWDCELLLENILSEIKNKLKLLKNGEFNLLKTDYYKNLYRFKKETDFL